MRRKGFTLIELIVVIAIIAILAAVIAPNAFKAIEKSKTSATLGELNAIKTAALSYFADVGGYPPSCQGTACANVHATIGGFVLQSTTATLGWDGPYLQKWPAASKFNGAYNWNNTDGTIFNLTSANERYVSVNGTAITANILNALDKSIDGGTAVNLAGGELRNTTATNAVFLVSRDGSVTPQ